MHDYSPRPDEYARARQKDSPFSRMQHSRFVAPLAPALPCVGPPRRPHTNPARASSRSQPNGCFRFLETVGLSDAQGAAGGPQMLQAPEHLSRQATHLRDESEGPHVG